MKQRFKVKFIPKSLQEYLALDQSIIEEVDKALESLEERADEVGKILGNRRQIILHGTREKKLRGSGIRIIYQITNQEVEVLKIVEVLLISFKKDETTLYKAAAARFSEATTKEISLDKQEELWWISASEPKELDKSSMIDQIFDENFDELTKEIADEILELYAHDQVLQAYELWKQYQKPVTEEDDTK